MSKVAVIGLWHLGLVGAASLADMGFQVSASEIDQDKVRSIQEGKLPLFEPGLDELFQAKRKSGSLLITKTMTEAVKGASVILMTYDTPVNDDDQVDLSKLEATLHEIVPHLERDCLLVIQSQIPVGTSKRWQEWIEGLRPKSNIDLVYSPENLRLGNAIELYKHPDMIVIGTNSQTAQKKAETFFTRFGSPCFWVNWETAELAKHALNTFFATSISFANELGRICEQAGANGLEIAKILKADKRIGPKAQVRPGLGFSGATLARDVRALQEFGERHQMETPVMDAVMHINDTQILHLMNKIENHFGTKLKGSSLAIWGLTYKAGTSTLRRSLSIDLIQMLEAKGVHTTAHDPMADLSELPASLSINFTRDLEQSVQNKDGIILMTEWEIYQKQDFSKIKKSLKNPFILDTKNHLDRKALEALHFNYLEIGRI